MLLLWLVCANLSAFGADFRGCDMANYTESGIVSKIRRKTDEAVANGLPESAGLVNGLFQYNGQDVIKKAAIPAGQPQQIAQSLAARPIASGSVQPEVDTLNMRPVNWTKPTADGKGTQSNILGAVGAIAHNWGQSSPGYLNDDIPAIAATAPATTNKQPISIAPAPTAIAATSPAKIGTGITSSSSSAARVGKSNSAINDLTVDQQLGQIAKNQSLGKETGRLPGGITGYVQVVGDTMDDRFKPGSKNGALLTDAGYYTGSDFGNSPMAAGGGKTRMSEIAIASDQTNQLKQQQAIARQQQIASQPKQQSVPSVDDYLAKIDPTVRNLAPMRALRIANESRNNDLRMVIAGQEVSQRGQQHAADLQQKQSELAAHKPVYDAQAGYYNSHAKLMEAQSSPEYLMRQERIAQIKDQAARTKEQQKLQQDMAAKWVKGQTGMEHPDDIKTAMSYMAAQDAFNQNFDAFVDKMDKGGRKWFVDGFKQGDQGVLEQLARRGIVKPQSPTFPARNPSTLGLQSEVK